MEFIFNIAIGIILCGFLFFSTTISDMTVEADLFGSGGFPILFSVIGLFLLLLSTLQTMKAKKTSADADKKEDDEAVLNRTGAKKVGCLILALAIYISLMTRVGFPIMTFLFIITCVTAVGYRDYKWSVLFALLFTTLLVIVFGRIFFIALPRGVGIFKDLSYFLY